MLQIAIKRNSNQGGRKIKVLAKRGKGRTKLLRLVPSPQVPSEHQEATYFTYLLLAFLDEKLGIHVQ